MSYVKKKYNYKGKNGKKSGNGEAAITAAAAESSEMLKGGL
jgi:hypothetical protein